MIFAIMSAIVGLAGYGLYVWGTIRSTTRPDPVFWGIWLIEYTSLVAAQAYIGAGWALLLPISQLLGVGTVFACSLRQGRLELGRTKLLLIAGVLGALVWWWVTSSATVAVLLLIAVENTPVVGTVVKAWKDPYSEQPAMWSTTSIAGILGILALGSHPSAILVAYPASLTLATGTVAVVALARRRTLTAPEMPEMLEA